MINSVMTILARIINSFILNGVYPFKLKMTKIVPVYKADDDSYVNNCRPVSLYVISFQ